MPARLAQLLDGDNGSLSPTLGLGDPIELGQRTNGSALLLGRQPAKSPLFAKASPSALPVVNVDITDRNSGGGDGGGSSGDGGDGGDGAGGANGGSNGSAGGDSGDGSGDGGDGGVA